MNPKDIVYKMVVLGRRLTTHFILDIFWGSSFMKEHLELNYLFMKPPVVEALLNICNL